MPSTVAALERLAGNDAAGRIRVVDLHESVRSQAGMLAHVDALKELCVQDYSSHIRQPSWLAVPVLADDFSPRPFAAVAGALRPRPGEAAQRKLAR